MTPIFILSLLRAGSTLLQRMLMGHAAIASTSEPWVLLPMAYMLPNEDGEIVGRYDHRLAQRAIADLVACLPGKEADYWRATREFTSSIYSALSGEGGRYFLDKTPRYYLILKPIEQMFPDARFIFLFRNPLAVAASLVKSFGEGRLGSPYESHIDLTEGPVRLVAGYRGLRNRSLKISYEELIRAPEQTLDQVHDYLNLSREKVNLSLDDKPTLDSVSRSDRLGILDMVDYVRSSLYRKFIGPTPRRLAKRILIPKLLPWR